PAQAGGVLGNLPRTRPAVRSPRRSQPGPPKRGAKPAADPAAQAEPAAPAARGRPGAEPPPERAEDGSQGELESLARGGIAIAGGAASLGLRIAGRAAAALRDAVERR
ncbi:MAG TPA: hypothetical protein VFH44_05635, partial [Solirubrobacterales bacterium]|nr:hypothetical protein [Solirubrobacterales bacterium]